MFDPTGVHIIAEIGANHDGDLDKAHRLIDMAADAGADFVKFQTYTAASLVADVDRVYTYGPEGRKRSETVGEMFDRLALPKEAHQELFQHALERGVVPFTTLFDAADVAFAEGLGQTVYKVASSDVTYRPLLEAIAETGKPVIISGGKCTIGELDRAVDLLGRQGSRIVVMHCVAAYPAPVEDANLRVLQTYERQFPDATLGFSDHTLGITCALGAVALGARVIEKHITYDKNAVGPDHWFSSDADELRALVAESKRLVTALGSSAKRVPESERYGMTFGRRSAVAARLLPAGHVLTPEDVKFLRPGTGINPFEADVLFGRECIKAMDAGEVITWEKVGSLK